MDTMGARLRKARLKKYRSATKAAEALGVSQSTYRAHENGQNDFDALDAERYGKKFGVPAGYLLTGEDPDGRVFENLMTQSPVDDANDNEDISRLHDLERLWALFDIVRNLELEKRHQLIAVIETFIPPDQSATRKTKTKQLR